MSVYRLHIEGLTELGLTWGLSLILVGVIYAITPRTITKVLMGLLMAVANVGFLSALWILSSTSPKYPLYYDYLYFITRVLLPHG